MAHGWVADPWARGTWCVLQPGQAAHLADAIRSEGRVAFASADLALGWRGYLDGAVESGLRAARDVLWWLSEHP